MQQNGHEQPSAEESRATILLVEDERDLADVGATMLAGFGYEVKIAHSAAEALDVLNKGETINVVFADVRMPGGMSGIDLALIVQRRFPGLPVLLTTGYSDAAMDALARGFQLLHKPYYPESLRHAIKHLLISSRMR